MAHPPTNDITLTSVGLSVGDSDGLSVGLCGQVRNATASEMGQHPRDMTQATSLTMLTSEGDPLGLLDGEREGDRVGLRVPHNTVESPSSSSHTVCLIQS